MRSLNVMCCWTYEQERVLRHAEELFEQGDANHDGMLSSEELQQLLLLVGSILDLLHMGSFQSHAHFMG